MTDNIEDCCNQMWDDCHGLSRAVIMTAMKHNVSVEYIWNMMNQTLQKDVFRLAESAEWIRKEKCAFCDRDGFHRIKLSSGSEKTFWVCPTHSMFVKDLLEESIKKEKRKKE